MEKNRNGMHGPDMRRPKVNLFTELGKVFKYMKGYVPVVVICLAMAAVSAVLNMIGPNFIGQITTLMQQGLGSEINLAAIGKIGAFLLIIYGCSAVLNFSYHFIMATITLKTSKSLRGELAEKINRVPMSYFNSIEQGNVLSCITNDIMRLQQGLNNGIPGIISSIAQVVGCLVMMIITDFRLTLCVMCLSFLGIILVLNVMGRSQQHFIKQSQTLGAMNGLIEEMYTGQSVVRISRAGRKINQRFDKLNDELYDANWKSQFISGIMQPMMMVIGNLGYVMVCVIGAAMAMNGIIEFGVIVSFILYVRFFTSPLTQIAQGMTNLQNAAASAKRVFDFLETEEMSDESHKTARIEAPKGDVEFKNVRFSYPDNPDKIIIKNFSVSVKAGQKVAIVGPTGAGKTTMVNLLMRFFEINSGSISIDGIPIADMKRENLHDLFSMVLQDTWLFEGTVRENLIYNMKDVPDEELRKVCAVCGLSHFIRTLPQGFDTVLSEKTTISAGQKQLLTIARAMLQNSPMLILDEATSSVDTRTEATIQEAMDRLTKGRTSFVIAHRLSTIKNADLILVMKDGDVIESGSHDELMAQGGFYSVLYNSQFEHTA